MLTAFAPRGIRAWGHTGIDQSGLVSRACSRLRAAGRVCGRLSGAGRVGAYGGRVAAAGRVERTKDHTGRRIVRIRVIATKRNASPGTNVFVRPLYSAPLDAR
jgi:hypothetical protein